MKKMGVVLVETNLMTQFLELVQVSTQDSTNGKEKLTYAHLQQRYTSWQLQTNNLRIILGNGTYKMFHETQIKLYILTLKCR
jgi:hypothetical protein